MMAEPFFSVTPAKKLRLSTFSDTKCIFCEEKFTSRIRGIPLDLETFLALLTACEDRDDAIGNTIISHKAEITRGSVTFRYHKSCRASYVSKQNIHNRKQAEGAPKGLHDTIWCKPSSDCTSLSNGQTVGADGDAGSYTRSQINESDFDWKLHCFICSSGCRQNDRYGHIGQVWYG